MVCYFVYQDHNISPPILRKPKVEDDCQELPCWEVTHFVWMIAWGVEDLHEEDVPKHILDSMPWVEVLQFYPCSCLRISNIWEGRTVVFPF